MLYFDIALLNVVLCLLKWIVSFSFVTYICNVQVHSDYSGIFAGWFGNVNLFDKIGITIVKHSCDVIIESVICLIQNWKSDTPLCNFLFCEV